MTDKTKNARIVKVLNELTVEQFLEIFSESLQERMSEIGYFVENGLIYIE